MGHLLCKINSSEYQNVLKDYDISINSGFLFQSKDIFSSFVEEFYSLRKIGRAHV